MSVGTTIKGRSSAHPPSLTLTPRPCVFYSILETHWLAWGAVAPIGEPKTTRDNMRMLESESHCSTLWCPSDTHSNMNQIQVPLAKHEECTSWPPSFLHSRRHNGLQVERLCLRDQYLACLTMPRGRDKGQAKIRGNAQLLWIAFKV